MFALSGLRSSAAVILALLLWSGPHVVRADPGSDVLRTCEAAGLQEARSRADALYDKGEYQRAAVCYDAAGDSTHAQQAYLKAARPNAEVAARGLKEEGATAKALLERTQQAFRGRRS